MRKNRLLRVSLQTLVVLSIPWSSVAEVSAYAPAASARASVGPSLEIGKCINLANTLEPPNEGDWGPAFRDEDARIIRSAGFSTVRVPINFIGHSLARPPFSVDPRFMGRARHVVDTLRDAGLNAIVDQHNNDALSAEPAANRDRLAAVWRQVASAFRDEPANVWFEILNEPHAKLTNANLMNVYGPSLAAIRETNPTRIVVIGGEQWSGIDSLATLPMPNDPNVIPTFHYYDPFEFTHQGASFVENPPPLGRSFGGPADLAQLDANLAKVRAYMQRTGRVPFVGEYGAIERIPAEQRSIYYRTVSSAFASLGIASCAWGYRNAFPLWRDGKWLPAESGIEAPK